MIKIKGYRHYDDYNEFKYVKEFSSTDDFEKWIQDTAINKKRIHLPAQNANGDFEQQYARSFSSHLSFIDENRSQLPSVSNHVCLIEKDGAIIFSSGDYTDGKGHISSEMKIILDHLKTYIAADYNFAP